MRENGIKFAGFQSTAELLQQRGELGLDAFLLQLEDGDAIKQRIERNAGQGSRAGGAGRHQPIQLGEESEQTNCFCQNIAAR